MSGELALYGVVVMLVVALIYQLVLRHRFKRRYGMLQRAEVEGFVDFLKINSREGNIQAVARGVSNLLTRAFACKSIIFLRMKRGQFELNYYYGVTRFSRSDFGLTFTAALGDKLKKDFAPGKIDELQSALPGDFYDLLKSRGLTTFFPIYWRENVYGLYFVSTSEYTDSVSFKLLVASLAQSLSAAYHVKWHENRYATLSARNKDEKTEADGAVATVRGIGGGLLRLMNYRRLETLVPRLVNSLKQELGVNRVAFFFGTDADNDRARVVTQGFGASVEDVSAEVLDDVIAIAAEGQTFSIDDHSQVSESVEAWMKQLKGHGLAYVTTIPMGKNRHGLLAVSGEKSPQSLNAYLQPRRRDIKSLMQNAEEFRRLEEVSFTDSLTELANQRYFFRRLDEEISRAVRYKRELGLIIFDLDDLKTINDQCGHLAGDAILKQMGQILKTSTRAIDVVARYGGDEFCVIMPEADSGMCVKFMQRLQAKIAESVFAFEERSQKGCCTISLGAAIFPADAQTAKDLVHAADMALLKAKARGRDRFLLSSDSAEVSG